MSRAINKFRINVQSFKEFQVITVVLSKVDNVQTPSETKEYSRSYCRRFRRELLISTSLGAISYSYNSPKDIRLDKVSVYVVTDAKLYLDGKGQVCATRPTNVDDVKTIR